MDKVTGDAPGLIHPAIRARVLQVAASRQQQIGRAAQSVVPILANAQSSLVRLMETKADVDNPVLGQSAQAIGVALTHVSASMTCWSNGAIPTSAELEAVMTCLHETRMLLAALGKRIAACRISAHGSCRDSLDIGPR